MYPASFNAFRKVTWQIHIYKDAPVTTQAQQRPYITEAQNITCPFSWHPACPYTYIHMAKVLLVQCYLTVRSSSVCTEKEYAVFGQKKNIEQYKAAPC